eukprot:1382297-Rhodomonas_salina.3
MRDSGTDASQHRTRSGYKTARVADRLPARSKPVPEPRAGRSIDLEVVLDGELREEDPWQQHTLAHYRTPDSLGSVSTGDRHSLGCASMEQRAYVPSGAVQRDSVGR